MIEPHEIKQNRAPQPQAQPQPQQKSQKMPSQYLHDTKTTFLVVITLVLGFIAFISLFFFLRIRNQTQIEIPEKEITQEFAQEEGEITTQPQKVEGELNIEAEVFELDKLNLGKIEDAYSNEILEN